MTYVFTNDTFLHFEAKKSQFKRTLSWKFCTCCIEQYNDHSALVSSIKLILSEHSDFQNDLLSIDIMFENDE